MTTHKEQTICHYTYPTDKTINCSTKLMPVYNLSLLHEECENLTAYLIRRYVRGYFWNVMYIIDLQLLRYTA